MFRARLLSLLLLVPGAPALAQSSEAPPERNPAPDESWAAPGEVAAPQRDIAPDASSGAGEVEAPRRNSAPDDAAWEDFPGATSVPTGQDAAR
ncbi:hypothetical protein ACLESD_53045, partial [Pyxidicoccus sp. 3LFB2]